ncbi:hypothetical protein NDU88_002868 [Pleurodeles waltl]|uniref:Uncharacterized protein n=1 Tax=Pleurodeles waltl TaxID=8319 RepID=A0AAV7M2X0_PLEWA|nr:hypothetical protein NDU88_002868 [Pleurodeles waltl]
MLDDGAPLSGDAAGSAQFGTGFVGHTSAAGEPGLSLGGAGQLLLSFLHVQVGLGLRRGLRSLRPGGMGHILRGPSHTLMSRPSIGSLSLALPFTSPQWRVGDD